MLALVLHSGGLDSTACLLKARESGRDVISFGIDYAQRHRIELLYAERQCRKFGIQRRVVCLEWSKPSRADPPPRSREEMRTAPSPAFLPARNAVFLTLALAEAAGQGADEIWIGVNALDFSGYPDCSPEFISSFRQMAAYAFPGGPELIAPLLELGKPEIAMLANSLGISRGETWSCYRPKIVPEGITPCNECDACRLDSYAWEKVGGRK